MRVEPTWRNGAGILLILLLILGWCVLVVSLSPWIGQLHILVQALIYLVTGIAWILPLKPLIRWMHTGRWSSFKSAGTADDSENAPNSAS